MCWRSVLICILILISLWYFVSPLIEPSGSECGNGVVQSGEECDCGTKNETLCEAIDSCCTVNCTLAPGAICRWGGLEEDTIIISYSVQWLCAFNDDCSHSAAASSCCDGTSCSALPAGTACRTGDIAQEGCQDDAVCNGTSPECPPTTPLPDGASCNNGENVCEDGSCIGEQNFIYTCMKQLICFVIAIFMINYDSCTHRISMLVVQ